MRSARFLALVGALLAVTSEGTVRARSPQEATFDVASIRANPSGRTGYKQTRISQDRVSITNAPLMQLVVMAYAVTIDVVAGGPDWRNDDGFDVEAKAEKPFASAEERQAMLRNLLADRFKLVVHREQRETATAMLTITRANGQIGPGLRPAQTPCQQLLATKTPDQKGNPCGLTGSEAIRGVMQVKGMALSTLVALVRRETGRPVVDATGLTGDFDWDLRWTPATFRQNPKFSRDQFPQIDPDGPAIETALDEQLGVTLVTRRVPVEFLVIDSAQRPTEN